MKEKKLILVASILVFCVFTCLLSACTGSNYGSNQLDYAVDYYVRGPEFVVRDLGNQRYLLAQDEYKPASNRVTHYRYYDRQAGILTRLKPRHWLVENRAVYTKMPVRYTSDDPQVIIFLDGGISRAEKNSPSIEDKEWKSVQGVMSILLSQDGGKTFLCRNVIVPGILAVNDMTQENMVFAEVHQHTLYIGIATSHIRGDYHDDFYAKLAKNKGDIAIARKIQEPVFEQVGSSYVSPPVGKFLSIMSVALPAVEEPVTHPLTFVDDEARHQYEYSLPNLVAFRLTGKELEGYKVAQTETETKPKLEEFHDVQFNKRQDLIDYIKPLKALHPEWASSQKVNQIPTSMRYETRQKIAERFSKQAPLLDDPIEWLRF